MPYSSGSFSLYSTGNPVVTGTTISSTWANNTLSDIATGLSTCILKDGTQTITANIPMSSFKFTGLAAGTVAGDSLRYEQAVGVFLPLAGGTLTGNLLFTDATYDIGASGATRPRDLFLSRNAVIGGTLNVTGHLTFEGVTSTGATGTGKLVYDTGATLASPTITTGALGSSTATTQSAGDNSTKVATTAYADRIATTLGTEQATTSGTSKNFTGFPAGTKRITINYVGVSTNGTSSFLVQIGPSGGVETTGYISQATTAGAARVTSTAGFIVTSATGATDTWRGTVTLTLENTAAFTWVSTGSLVTVSGGGVEGISAGSKSLAAELTQLTITMVNGTDAYDAGVVNVSYSL